MQPHYLGRRERVSVLASKEGIDQTIDKESKTRGADWGTEDGNTTCRRVGGVLVVWCVPGRIGVGAADGCDAMDNERRR